MTKFFKNLREVFQDFVDRPSLLAFSLLGATIIVFGAYIDSKIFIAVGSALFGSCLGSFIGRLTNKDLLNKTKGLFDDIKFTLSEFIKGGITSDENKLNNFRIQWHIYHVTQMNKQLLWRHVEANFKNSYVPGKLTATTELTNKDGYLIQYSLEGGIRDHRLIVFIKAMKTEEPSGVYVFPLIGLDFDNYNFGILFHQTWDTTNAISPAILTREQIIFDKPIDSSSVNKHDKLTEEQENLLDDIWRNGATSKCTILPRVSQEIFKDTHDVFLSSPMAVFQNGEKYNQNLCDTRRLESTLKEVCKFKSVFYPGEQIGSPADFDAPDIAAKTDLENLRKSKYFVLYYPEKCVSSVIFEAGVALALQKPSVYFVKDRNDLPFLMRNAEQAFKNVKIYECDTIDKTLSLINRNSDRLFVFK